jgi:hypothetical protein
MEGRHMGRTTEGNGVRNHLFARKPSRKPSVLLVLTIMSSSGVKPPLKLLALGKRVILPFPPLLTSNPWTDGGGIRGLSELLIIKEIMHRLMVEENLKRESEGRPLLTSLPKPCHYFNLIGGTSTGG